MKIRVICPEQWRVKEPKQCNKIISFINNVLICNTVEMKRPGHKIEMLRATQQQQNYLVGWMHGSERRRVAD